MKRKIIIGALLISVIALLLLSCINPFLPVYEYEETDENGMTVIIDGVKYVQYPELKWDITPSGKVIGYAGSLDIKISEAAREDTSFVFVHDNWKHSYDKVLYRAGTPDVSAESVDRIVWDKSGRKDSQIVDTYTNTIEDKEVIKQLFDILENGERVQDIYWVKKDSLDWFFISILFYRSDLPSARFSVSIGMKDGEMIGVYWHHGYVKIPEDLLKRISGRDIDYFKSIKVKESKY